MCGFNICRRHGTSITEPLAGVGEWDPRIPAPCPMPCATPNNTDEPRVAHVIIFMDCTTTYTGKRHVVTDPLDLEIGAPLDGDLFPAVRDFATQLEN